mgnify:CR=1 FL=1
MSSFTNLKAKCVNELRRALNELEFSGDVATFSMLFIEEDKEPAREFRVAFLEASNKKLAVVFRDALALATGEKLENTPTAHLPYEHKSEDVFEDFFCDISALAFANYNVQMAQALEIRLADGDGDVHEDIGPNLSPRVVALVGYYLGHDKEPESNSWERAGFLYQLYTLASWYLYKTWDETEGHDDEDDAPGDEAIWVCIVLSLSAFSLPPLPLSFSLLALALALTLAHALAHASGRLRRPRGRRRRG